MHGSFGNWKEGANCLRGEEWKSGKAVRQRRHLRGDESVLVRWTCRRALGQQESNTNTQAGKAGLLRRTTEWRRGLKRHMRPVVPDAGDLQPARAEVQLLG